MYTIDQICDEYGISRSTINRRRSELEIDGTTNGGSRLLYFTQEEVEQLTQEQGGILASQAIDILLGNGWDYAEGTLGNMLQSGIINGIELDIDKTVTKRWRYRKSQISKLYPQPKPKVLSISEKCEQLGISRQTYYNWLNKGKLTKKLQEAGL